MGSGVIKPNISTLMGMTYDQKRPGNDELRTTAFSLFYIAINIGSALSTIVVPWIRTNYSYRIAFLVPAILMAMAFVIFAAGKRFYAHETISKEKATPEEKALRLQILGRIGGLFLLAAFFWMIFDQSSSTWIIFGRLYQDTALFGYHIDVEQVQATNPILIVVMTPLFAAFWAIMRSKGMAIRATDKILGGFLLTALCMGAMGYPALTAGPLETQLVPLGKVESEAEASAKLNKEAMPQLYAGMIANAGVPMLSIPEAVNAVAVPMQGTKLYVKPENKVTIWWQVLAFFIITIAEILISITGLELAFTAAPKTMKSFVTSLWLLTVFAGNVFNMGLARLYPNMNPGHYFFLMVALMVIVAICFQVVAMRFNRIMAEQEAAAKAAASPGSAN
jgi:solute carrier family 15 (oligopeptide transporter), member 1